MRSDSELVAAWLGGEANAFADIYDRYADSLYAFAVSRLRDRTEAADVVQDTFVRAAGRLGQLRDPTRLRAWLYAIARNRVMDRARRPVQFADAQELTEMPSDNIEPAEAVARSELSELVWMAADGLNQRDQELLGLHLRDGLDGADLAAVVGMSPSQVYVAMNRLKERMAKAVGSLLIARHGSPDCSDLSALLAGWDGTFSLDVRSKVTRHVEGCDVCARRRAALVAPSNFAAGAFLLPLIAPAALRDDTLRRVADRVQPAADDSWQWDRDGFPRPGRTGVARRTRLVLVASLAAIAVIGASVALLASAGDTERSLSAGDAPTTAASNLPSAPIAPVTETVLTATTTTAPIGEPVTTAAPGNDGMADAGPKPSVLPDSDGDAGLEQATIPVPTPPASDTTVTAAAAPPPPTSAHVAAPSSTVPAVVTTAAPSSTAAATTAVATTAVATTAAPTTAPPPPPPPGHVVVLTSAIDLGASQTTGQITIRNDGGQPIAWSATTSLGAFSVSPSSGSVAAGQDLALQVGVNRAALAEGTHSAAVAINSANGSGNVTVIARVERAPVISSISRTPTTLRTPGSCGPTLTTVTVVASDESGIASVKIVWSPDGVFAQTTTLTPDGSGQVFTGKIGSFTKVGTNNLTAQVLDTRGNLATTTTTVTVIAC